MRFEDDAHGVLLSRKDSEAPFTNRRAADFAIADVTLV